MTNVDFTTDELNILNKGYNYAPTRKSLSNSRLLEIRARIEGAMRRLPVAVEDHYKKEFTGALHRIIREKQTLPFSEMGMT